MKKKKKCIFWIIAAVVVVAASVAVALFYKKEILECISYVKDNFERKKYARICRKEYEDYADIE